MKRYVLSLGSNMGDRLSNLYEAKRRISDEIGEIRRQSSVYETAAWGNENQSSFYNQLIEGYTGLRALKLMERLLKIETEMGRARVVKWSPRTIDLDIIFYESEIIEEDQLSVPHPMFHLRKFTLIPLVEMMPEFIDPRSGKTMKSLLNELSDELEVIRLA